MWCLTYALDNRSDLLFITYIEMLEYINAKGIEHFSCRFIQLATMKDKK